MSTIEIISLCSAASAVLVALLGVCAAYFWGYLPKKKLQKTENLYAELLQCYRDIQGFIEIERDYMEEECVGKKTTRKGLIISENSQPKHVESRIHDLEEQLKY